MILTKEMIKNDYKLAENKLLTKYIFKNNIDNYFSEREELKKHYQARLGNINISPEYLDEV